MSVCSSAFDLGLFPIELFKSEVGGSETNREIVSVRSHARTRGLVLRSELGKKRLGWTPFPFPFWRRRVSSSEFWEGSSESK